MTRRYKHGKNNREGGGDKKGQSGIVSLLFNILVWPVCSLQSVLWQSVEGRYPIWFSRHESQLRKVCSYKYFLFL